MPTNYYELTRPAKVKSEDFETFMTEKVLPSVRRGATRVGSVTGLRLLKDVPETRKYMWAIEWDGLNMNPASIAAAFRKLKTAGTRSKLLGTI
jgi:hypothetical protein